jgi:hypothetical protein
VKGERILKDIYHKLIKDSPLTLEVKGQREHDPDVRMGRMVGIQVDFHTGRSMSYHTYGRGVKVETNAVQDSSRLTDFVLKNIRTRATAVQDAHVNLYLDALGRIHPEGVMDMLLEELPLDDAIETGMHKFLNNVVKEFPTPPFPDVDNCTMSYANSDDLLEFEAGADMYDDMNRYMFSKPRGVRFVYQTYSDGRGKWGINYTNTSVERYILLSDIRAFLRWCAGQKIAMLTAAKTFNA